MAKTWRTIRRGYIFFQQFRRHLWRANELFVLCVIQTHIFNFHTFSEFITASRHAIRPYEFFLPGKYTCVCYLDTISGLASSSWNMLNVSLSILNLGIRLLKCNGLDDCLYILSKGWSLNFLFFLISTTLFHSLSYFLSQPTFIIAKINPLFRI